MRVPAFAQGVFYVATGLWPVFHLKSFEAVTGKKRDGWLAQTTGALIAAVGGALLVGAFERRARQSRTLSTLGVASAAALGAADLYFATKGTIPKVYLGDAALEAAAIAGWIADS